MFSEFSDCISWWENRKEDEHAWFVSSEDLKARNYDFAIKNPNVIKQMDERNLDEIYASMRDSSNEIVKILGEINKIIGG